MNDDLLVQRILEVLNGGDRVATYKLALLLAIIEWVTTNPGGEQIPTRDLAEIVLAQYFRQVRPFPNAGGELLDLQQGSNPKLAILSAATRLAATYPQLSRIDQIKTQDQSLYNSAVRDVEATLVSQPIPRLQTVGKTHIPFLYQWNWKTKQAVGPIKAAGEDHLSLVPGVRERLVGLGPLLRPIIEQFWVWDVATWSKIETQEVELRAHLFGSKRASFPKKLVSGLSESQAGKCFYCASSIAMSGEVDHFVPWSKFPNDAIENLVLACKKCNGKKSDHLCVPQFAERWLSRPDEELARIATTSQWDTDPRRSRAIAANIYGSLVAGSVVWAGAENFVEWNDAHRHRLTILFPLRLVYDPPPWVIEVVSAIVESALLGTSKLVSRCLIALLRSWQQPTTDCVAWGSRNQCAAPNSEVIGEGRCSIADCGEWITYKNIAISSVKSIQGFTLSKRLDGLGFRR